MIRFAIDAVRRIIGAFAASAMLVMVFGAGPALAHLNPDEHGSFMAGVTHPLFGLDHILAMVAVGLWAAMLGGRAVWIVPAAFVATMAAGFGLAAAGIELPFVEPAILASVVVLGLAIAAAVRLPVMAGAALVAVFALFHGHAHGAELGTATAMPYLIGFVFATSFLHAAGIAVGFSLGSGLGISAAAGRVITRTLGGAAAVIGILLMTGMG